MNRALVFAARVIEAAPALMVGASVLGTPTIVGAS